MIIDFKNQKITEINEITRFEKQQLPDSSDILLDDNKSNFCDSKATSMIAARTANIPSLIPILEANINNLLTNIGASDNNDNTDNTDNTGNMNNMDNEKQNKFI